MSNSLAKETDDEFQKTTLGMEYCVEMEAVVDGRLAPLGLHPSDGRWMIE